MATTEVLPDPALIPPAPVYKPLEQRTKFGSTRIRVFVADQTPVMIATVNETKVGVSGMAHRRWFIPGYDKRNTNGVGGARLPYAFTMIYAGFDKEDLGDGKTHLDVTYTPRQVAEGIVTKELYNRGYFVPAGATPTKDELDAAYERFITYCQRMLRAGDIEYAKHKQVGEVDGNSIMAARVLGVSREWAGAEKNECPACGQTIKTGVTKCVHCQTIIDPAEHERRFGKAKTA